MSLMQSYGDDAELGVEKAFLWKAVARAVRRDQPINGSRETADGTAFRSGSGKVASREYFLRMRSSDVCDCRGCGIISYMQASPGQTIGIGRLNIAICCDIGAEHEEI